MSRTSTFSNFSPKNIAVPPTSRNLSPKPKRVSASQLPPTALEFLRLANVSRPVVIEGTGSAVVPSRLSLTHLTGLDIPAFKRWTDDHLSEKMGDRLISVSVTPDGRADAIHGGPDGKLYFVEPHVEKMSMKGLLKRIQEHFLSGDFTGQVDTESEFVPLQEDVPSEISWCSEALGRPPEAVNLWIGNSKSITSVHSDPYENIYVVVRGKKKFTLIPPTDGWCLQERFYPHARFSRHSPSSLLEIVPSPSDTPMVRWSSLPDRRLSEVLPDDICPLHVELEAGQTLYLPVGWWHQVEQSEETTIALNWWYDAETRGLTWAVLSTLREAVQVDRGNK
ncbi:phospholipase [Coprinopsis cinerea okayama7|uniref:Phospholipase n=1 Tax=Coprinopsis cinerea (strain Okayama-7 / 130 / ATCC MYA-4618 / FGSC 9003) TaxID=240176 RepID=D6RMV7_COPC7|nr:phospholipase [Coprinopsis cinerea okayama7\|eukprot:XP_002911198.1 phospholipase [Coprinopsis cinerea okayama7\